LVLQVSGGRWKGRWQTRATKNVAARVLTHHAGPPIPWAPSKSSLRSIAKHEHQPTSLRGGEGHGRLRVCVGRRLGGEDGGEDGGGVEGGTQRQPQSQLMASSNSAPTLNDSVRS
jgi:hypothetical protein